MTAATLTSPWTATVPVRTRQDAPVKVSTPVRMARTDGREDDLACVEALIAGRQDAWQDFVARYARVIYAAVQRRLVPAGRVDTESIRTDTRAARACRGVLCVGGSRVGS